MIFFWECCSTCDHEFWSMFTCASMFTCCTLLITQMYKFDQLIKARSKPPTPSPPHMKMQETSKFPSRLYFYMLTAGITRPIREIQSWHLFPWASCTQQRRSPPATKFVDMKIGTIQMETNKSNNKKMCMWNRFFCQARDR